MLDTLAAARRLTDAGIKPEHADAIVDAVRMSPELIAILAVGVAGLVVRERLAKLEGLREAVTGRRVPGDAA